MPRGRSGITLIEVVATGGIITLLLCLIVPAIDQGRRASRRVQCANNYKQLLLGLHHYESQCRTLPPGVVDPTGPIHNRREGLHQGWIAALLPFIDHAELAAAINPTCSIHDQANGTVTATRLGLLICPSDPLLARPSGSFVAQPGVPWAGSSYAGCHHDVEAPIDRDNHGVFFLNSSVRSEDVTDGTSLTIFVGEKPSHAGELGWGSGTRATLRNTGTPLNDPRTFSGDLSGYPDAADALAVGGFASYHPGGANIGFGDGSVRFLRQTIDITVYQRLGHRDDGELISSSALETDSGRPYPGAR